jgi:hypothetical protein
MLKSRCRNPPWTKILVRNERAHLSSAPGNWLRCSNRACPFRPGLVLRGRLSQMAQHWGMRLLGQFCRVDAHGSGVSRAWRLQGRSWLLPPWRNSAILGSCMHLPMWLLLQNGHATGFKPQSKESSQRTASCSIGRACPSETDNQSRSQAAPGNLSVSSPAMQSAFSSENSFSSVAALPERPCQRIQATEHKEITEKNVRVR